MNEHLDRANRIFAQEWLPRFGGQFDSPAAAWAAFHIAFLYGSSPADQATQDLHRHWLQEMKKEHPKNEL